MKRKTKWERKLPTMTILQKISTIIGKCYGQMDASKLLYLVSVRNEKRKKEKY